MSNIKIDLDNVSNGNARLIGTMNELKDLASRLNRLCGCYASRYLGVDKKLSNSYYHLLEACNKIYKVQNFITRSIIKYNNVEASILKAGGANVSNVNFNVALNNVRFGSSRRVNSSKSVINIGNYTQSVSITDIIDSMDVVPSENIHTDDFNSGIYISDLTSMSQVMSKKNVYKTRDEERDYNISYTVVDLDGTTIDKNFLKNVALDYVGGKYNEQTGELEYSVRRQVVGEGYSYDTHYTDGSSLYEESKDNVRNYYDGNEKKSNYSSYDVASESIDHQEKTKMTTLNKSTEHIIKRGISQIINNSESEFSIEVSKSGTDYGATTKVEEGYRYRSIENKTIVTEGKDLINDSENWSDRTIKDGIINEFKATKSLEVETKDGASISDASVAASAKETVAQGSWQHDHKEGNIVESVKVEAKSGNFEAKVDESGAKIGANALEIKSTYGAYDASSYDTISAVDATITVGSVSAGVGKYAGVDKSAVDVSAEYKVDLGDSPLEDVLLYNSNGN